MVTVGAWKDVHLGLLGGLAHCCGHLAATTHPVAEQSQHPLVSTAGKRTCLCVCRCEGTRHGHLLPRAPNGPPWRLRPSPLPGESREALALAGWGGRGGSGGLGLTWMYSA